MAKPVNDEILPVYALLVGDWMEGFEVGSERVRSRRLDLDLVRSFFKDLDRKGGWWWRVWIRPCQACGELVAGRSSLISFHPACGSRVRGQRKFTSRKQRGLNSTPYTRTWAQRNPDKVFAYQLQAHIPPRPRRAMTAEEKTEHYRVSRESSKRVNDESRATADSLYERWTPDENEWLIGHQDWSATAAAAELGRTVAGIKGRRRKLRRQGVLPPRGVEPIEVVAFDEEHRRRQEGQVGG